MSEKTLIERLLDINERGIGATGAVLNQAELGTVFEAASRIELLERIITKLGVDAMMTQDDEEAVLKELATEDRYYEIMEDER